MERAIKGLFLACGLLLGSVSVGAIQLPDVPVMYGDEPDMDACGGWGIVTNLNPNGDNFLSVRSGPATRYAELDRLGPNQGIWVCDQKGKWIGIVYDKSGTMDCGTSSSIARLSEYRGPCSSGWVFGKYVKLLAG